MWIIQPVKRRCIEASPATLAASRMRRSAGMATGGALAILCSALEFIEGISEAISLCGLCRPTIRCRELP